MEVTNVVTPRHLHCLEDTKNVRLRKTREKVISVEKKQKSGFNTRNQLAKTVAYILAKQLIVFPSPWMDFIC